MSIPGDGSGPVNGLRWILFSLTFTAAACGAKPEAPRMEVVEKKFADFEPKSDDTGRFSPRVRELVEQLTIEEKVGQLTQRAGGRSVSPNSELTDAELDLVRAGMVGSYLHVVGSEATARLQTIAVNESPHQIPLLFGLDVVHGYRTIFPVPLASAASFSVAEVENAARIAAREAAAAGVQWTFAPMVDIARDPRWGRIVEGAGEDPYLGSVMAAAQVRGYQGQHLGASDTLLACAKHFIGYGAAVGGRDYDSVNLSRREIWDVYMPPFLAAVDAGVGSVMTGFTDLSGTPMTMNRELLFALFKESFNGVVVSDWNAVAELMSHGVAESPENAAALALEAGVHMDMWSGLFSAYLPEMVRSGKVSRAFLDEAVSRVLQAKFDLGLFDDPFRYGAARNEVGDTLPADHVAAARRLAAGSMVLLKNNGGRLPLDKSIKRLAVIGPLADDPESQLGSWSAVGRKDDVVSFLTGIREAVGEGGAVLFEKGCDVQGDDTRGIPRAVKIAKKADAVILVLGESGDMTGEARSRSDIGLPGVQSALAKAVIGTGMPVVVVLTNGRPLAIPWLAEHADAILEAWLPGVAGGPALADILFGDVNPSGKLPVTFPRGVGQVPIYYAHRATGRPADPDVARHSTRYQDLPITPQYAFGHGLSYTTFEYSNLTVNETVEGKEVVFELSMEIANVGERDGVEVVQVYVRDEVASSARPVKQLVAFERVPIPAGERKHLTITVPRNRLAFYTDRNRFEVEPGLFQLMIGAASDDIRLNGIIHVME